MQRRHSDLATRLGTAARERVATELSVPRMIERHVALYRELNVARRSAS